MKIQNEKIMGLWGEKYYTLKEDSGLIFWSNTIRALAQVITQIDEKGCLYLSDRTIEPALAVYPSLALLALSSESELEVINGIPWTTIGELERDGRKQSAKEIRQAVEQRGFAVLDYPASRYVRWVAIPNTERGGH